MDEKVEKEVETDKEENFMEIAEEKLNLLQEQETEKKKKKTILM